MPFTRASKPQGKPAAELDSTAPADRRLAVADCTEVQPLVMRLQVESDAGVRHAILTRLGALSGAEVAAQLVGMLASEDVLLRNDAILALRRCGEVAVPALADALGSADPDVRIFAANALEGISVHPARVLLTRLIAQEADASVCLAAVEALAQIGTSADAAALSALSARFPEEPGIGFAVALALDAIGAGA